MTVDSSTKFSSSHIYANSTSTLLRVAGSNTRMTTSETYACAVKLHADFMLYWFCMLWRFALCGLTAKVASLSPQTALRSPRNASKRMCRQKDPLGEHITPTSGFCATVGSPEDRVRAETQRPLPKPEPEPSSVPELPEPAGTAGTQGAKHGQMHRIWHRFCPRYASFP
jgi:hypothetical protein